MIIKNLTKEIEKYNLIFFNTINKGSIKINELTLLLSGKKKFINKDINEMIIIPKIRFVEYSKKFG